MPAVFHALFRHTLTFDYYITLLDMFAAAIIRCSLLRYTERLPCLPLRCRCRYAATYFATAA